MPAMRTTRHRGPAVSIALPQPIPEHFKQIDRARAYDRRSELATPAQRTIAAGVDRIGWKTTRIDMVQVNPVLEHPKIIAPSRYAPITRWGVRQINRTGMSARPRFLERFVLVGHLVKQAYDRQRMQGAAGRTVGGAYVYLYPQFVTGNRAVVLGGAPAVR